MTPTRLVSNTSFTTSDGTSYNYSAKVDDAPTNVGVPVNVYFDDYDYVIYSDDITASGNYAVVLNYGTAWAVNTTTDVQLLLTDGTVVSGRATLATGGTNLSQVGDIVKYNVREDGVYVLDHAANKYAIAAKVNSSPTTITQNTPTFSDGASEAKNFTANNKTTFLVGKDDGTFSVYVGINNVPTITIAANDTITVFRDGDDQTADDKVALVVYIPKGTEQSSANTITEEIFLINDTGRDITEQSGTYDVWNAIVDGKKTTVNIASALTSGTATAATLYRSAGHNAQGYITSLTAMDNVTGSLKMVFKNGESSHNIAKQSTYSEPKDGVISLPVWSSVNMTAATNVSYTDSSVVYVIDGQGNVTSGGLDEVLGILNYTSNQRTKDKIVGYVDNTNKLGHLYVFLGYEVKATVAGLGSSDTTSTTKVVNSNTSDEYVYYGDSTVTIKSTSPSFTDNYKTGVVLSATNGVVTSDDAANFNVSNLVSGQSGIDVTVSNMTDTVNITVTVSENK